MIQEFLTNNLIQITEDENVEKLLKASVALEKKLSKDKSKIPTFTLIAIDPEVIVTDPNVQEVQELIINNWKTFTSNCKDTPLTYIRAVILETLEKLSSDINVANIVFLSSRNIIKHINLKGKECNLIVEFFKELGNKVEKNASDNWSIIKSEIIKDTSFEIAKISNISIDKSALEKHLMAALGHSSYGAGGENPHWCNQNNANWPTFFSQRASSGIIETITAAVNKQVSLINDSNSKIQDLLKNSLTQLLKENANQNNSLYLRSELLWWKEACYSKILNDSYRNAQNGLLQFILALDYSSFVPFIYPQSADYFLKEAHSGIISVEDKKMKFSEIFKFIDSSKELLKQHISEESFEIERVSLAQFIKGYANGKYSTKQLKYLVGITDSIELTLSEFTLWLFHDLQVLNYSKSK